MFNAIQYGVRRQDNLLDYDQVESLAKEHQPKLLIAGGSAIPRQIDFARMRQIADMVGAYLHVDMAHFAGLIAGGGAPISLSTCTCCDHHNSQKPSEAHEVA